MQPWCLDRVTWSEVLVATVAIWEADAMTLEGFSAERFTRLSDVLAANAARLWKGEDAGAGQLATGC